MNNPLLTYTQPTQASVDKDACYVTIQALKERFRSILRIEDCNCVLISVIQKESSKETTIMVECEKTEKMKMYTFEKLPSDITDEDIQQTYNRIFKPPIQSISVI